MPNLSDIKRRIKSVKNTKQITKAMKMVSAAKLRRAQDDITAARPYAEKMSEMIESLSSRVSQDGHPLFSSGATGKCEVIVVASDRGLCGGFNTSIFRNAQRFLGENKKLDISLNLVGRRSIDFFKSRGYNVHKKVELGNKRPDFSIAADIAGGIIDRYLAEDGLESVYLVYSRFQSALTQVPTIQKILPMEAPEVVADATGHAGAHGAGGHHATGAGAGDMIFEPSAAGVLDNLLPKYVEVQIFKALLESAASEHGARMTAMDSASKNATSMIGSLTLIYNRARQASITKELMEIIGGAEALK